jgi:hypothetical protein
MLLLRSALFFSALSLSSIVLAVGEPDLAIEFVTPSPPSSFTPLLWLHVTNQAYTPLDLMDMMAASELIIDGKSYPRTSASFEGRPGIPPTGEWQGCLPIDDYASALTPGKHQVRFKMGGVLSNSADVRLSPPFNWRQGNLASRLKEVRGIASSIKKGLPRPCVERWLLAKDGGLQAAHQVRYYLEPQIKVLVPYASAGDLGHDDEVVSGSVKVYQEAHFQD